MTGDSATPSSIAVTFRDFIRFAFKWWVSIVAVIVIVVGTVSCLAYFGPQRFTARSQILIDSIQAIATQNNPMPGIDMDVALNTEIQILRSRPVMDGTVEQLGLGLMQPKQTGLNGVKLAIQRTLAEYGLVSSVNETENWIGALLDDVRVKAIPRSNVLQIEFSYSNARLAADIVNALTDRYVQHHVHVYTANDIHDFYARQVEVAESQLQYTLNELTALRTSPGSSASPEASAIASQGVASLREQESRVLAELIELRTQYEPTSERVLSAEERLRLITSRIEAASANIFEIERRTDLLDELEVRIATQRENYERVLKLMEDAALTAQATAGTSNVRVIEYAVAPLRPDHDRLFFIVVSLLAGSGLAVAVALLREYFDQRVERTDLAEKLLGRPVYGAIPSYNGLPDFSNRG